MQSLNNLLIDSDDGHNVGLIIPEARTFLCSLEIPCPSFDVDVGRSNEVVVQFEIDDQLSMLTSISESYKVPRLYSKLRSFKHDFTFSCLSNDTDIALKRFFPDMQESDAILTPDVVISEDQTIYIVEFTTRHSANEQQVKNAYLEKMHKYQPVLLDQTILPPGKNRIVFFIIAVGLQHAYTNMMLTEETLQELIVRYNISCKVHENLIVKGYITQDVSSLTDQEGKLLEWFKSISLKSPNLTKEYSYQNYLKTMEPPNESKVSEVISQCLTGSINEILKHRQLRQSNENHLKGLEAWQKYVLDLETNNPQGFSSHPKSICTIPWMNLKVQERSTAIPEWRFMGMVTDHTSEAWVSAFDEVVKLKNAGIWNDNMLFSTIEEQSLSNLRHEVSEVISDQKERKEKKTDKTKSSFQRVPLNLELSSKIELAKLGVSGKQFSSNSQVLIYRESKKKGFSVNTDTSDIDSFMMKDKLKMFKSTKPLNTVSSFMLNLIKTADDLHGAEHLSSRFRTNLEWLMSTPYYQWCKIVSDIGNEVAVSMKQHCKAREFVLKKLQDWPIYLLLKPTKSSSHCFFSLMVWNDDFILDKENYGTIFRQWNSNGIISWTDFISLNASKITNWVLMEARAIDLCFYWLDFYKVEPFLDLESDSIEKELKGEMCNMIWITTLISLIDKAEVEEVCSLSRFIFMEGFVTYPLIPRPYKMYEKFPTHIRSRLTVFLINKLRTASDLIVNGGVRMVIEENKEAPGETITMTEQFVKWEGLKNWVTGYPLDTPGQIVNLMYLGYIKNKNENPESNTETKLIEKILVLEDKLTPEISDRIGQENKVYNSGTSHEWNIDLLKWCCIRSKSFLIKKGTLRDDDDLRTQLVSRLARISVEEVLMTLKASSNFDEEWYHYNPTEKEVIDEVQPGKGENQNRKRPYYRSKVIEKSLKLTTNDRTMLMDILPQCLADCVERNHMRICIFKKQQHGGLREIYVLNISERVVQFTLELMGRMICELFLGETMTHPESKSTLPRDHLRRTQHRFKRKGRTITTSTSADSAKWSQNQYCFKLATVLLYYFPIELHGFILQATQLWRNKFIKIGDALLDLFSTKNTLKLWNPLHQKMYDAYHGHIEVPWMRKGESFVRVKSGMMQGILHYVSSAFHTIVNHGMTEAITQIVQSRSPGFNLECTSMQSSDDSGLILSVNAPDSYSKVRLLTTLAFCHIFKWLFSEEVAIKNSIKTTFHTSRVYEFNSRFYFSSQLFEPDIKLLFASVLISQQENLLDRQDELYTLISSFVGVGGSFYLAKFAQYAQAVLYYRCLGITVCPEFGLLKSVLSYVKDPSLGFFLTDHPFFCGVSGLKYNLWNCVSTSSLSGIYRKQLERIVSNNPNDNKEDVLATVSSGQLLRRVHVGWGSSQKLQAMKTRMGIPDDWQTLFNENPEVLFRDAKTSAELIAKAALKLNQHGVASSLSTGIPITSIIATSVYILRDFVFSIGESNSEINMEETEYKGNRHVKASIFQLLLQLLVEECEGLTEEQEVLLFPNRNGFLELRRKLDALRDAQIVRKTLERRRIVTKLIVYDRENTTPISTLTLLKLIWFPDLLGKPNVRFSRRLLEPLFKNLQTQVTWLDHDPKKSLEASPFEHMHQMVNWFRSFDDKERVMCLLGAPLLSRRGRSTMMSALVNNFHNSYKLHFDTDQIETDRISCSNILQTMLLVLLFPYTKLRKTELVVDIVKSLPSTITFNMAHSKSRSNTLVIMKEALADNPNLPYIYDCIEKNKVGFVGYWSKRQIWNTEAEVYEGDGEWTGIISGKKTKIGVSYSRLYKKNVLRKLEVDNLHLLERQDWAIGLREWCKEGHIEEVLMGASPYRYRRLDGLYFYNGRVQTENKGIRLEPLDLTEGFLKQMDNSSNFTIEVEDRDCGKSNGSMLVRLKQLIQNKYHTILSLGLRHTDWNCSETTKVIPFEKYTSSWDKAWCMNLSMDPIDTHGIFNMPDSKFKSLVISVSRYTLEQKGIILKYKVPQETIIRTHLATEQDAQLFVDEPLFLPEGIDLDELMGFSEDESDDEDDSETYDDDLILDVEWDQEGLNDMIEEHQDLLITHVCKSHRMCQDYINDLLSTTNVTSINNVLNSGLYRSDQRDIVTILSQIYPERGFTLITDYRLNPSSYLRLPADFE